LKNATKLHLMQGPITVFDAEQYAGDARIADISPEAERLVTYALDLKTEITVEERTTTPALVAVRIDSGMVKARERQMRYHTYAVKHSGSDKKEILLEQLIDANWELVAPAKPAEKTRDLYRFAATALPEKTLKLVVEEQRLTDVEHVIASLDDKSLGRLIGGDAASPAVQKVYQQLLERRRAFEEATKARVDLETEIRAIAEDQTRIRSNMDRLDRESELYRSYVKKLTEQEETIVNMRELILMAKEKETAAEASLKTYMASVNAK
jgi:hypothetical protein